MSKVGIWDRFVAERPNAAALTTSKPERPVRTKMSKKAQAKAAEAAEQHTEAPTSAAESVPTPEPEPSDADMEQDAPAASTGSGSDETPASDATPTDVQETPEG
jgi:hypothetical protein